MVEGWRWLPPDREVEAVRFEAILLCQPAFGFRASGFGFQVSGFRFRVWGFGFWIQGFEFGVWGFGFRG